MNIRRPMRRIAIWGCVIVGGTVLAVALFMYGLFFITQPWHDLTLWHMEQAIASTAHPESRVMEERMIIGSQYADSWDCSYFVGQLRKTTLSPSDVLRAYQGRTIPLFTFAHSLEVQVALVDGETSLPLGHPADTWEFDTHGRFDSERQEETHYIVFLFETNKQGLGDVRCYETGLNSSVKSPSPQDRDTS